MAEEKKRDLKTEVLVLKRTNYGETDRILSLLTPEGKKSVLAKSVRRERSKLAGGIEMFCCSEVVLHQGRGELAILTSAKMQKFYKNIMANFETLETASEILKRVNKVAEGTDNPDYYKITKASLAALDDGAMQDVVLAWFYFNMAKTGGEQINLFYDANGEKLAENKRYNWDNFEKALRPNEQGRIGAKEIKMLRLMQVADLKLVLRVKDIAEMAQELLYIAKTLNQL